MRSADRHRFASLSSKCRYMPSLQYSLNSITSICCGFVVQQLVINTTSAVTRWTDASPCLFCWSQVRRHVNCQDVVVIACPHWRQKLPKTATNCRQKRQQMLPKTATRVALSGKICCRFWRQFVSLSGKPFSATIASATICRRFRQLLSPVWTGY